MVTTRSASPIPVRENIAVSVVPTTGVMTGTYPSSVVHASVVHSSVMTAAVMSAAAARERRPG